MKRLPKDLCPDKRVTRQIANKRSLGLHPLVAIFDECQNLFAHPEYGAQAGDDAEFVIKVGRALGVTLILATQRPDKDSLPTGVSGNVSIRFCLKVAGQVENDMILGTSSYKNGIRATSLRPEVDAGIGYLVGASSTATVTKVAYLDQNDTEKIATRALALRTAAGTLSGHALGQAPEHAPTHDLLADVLAVVPTTEAKVWNVTVVDRLVELRPETYVHWADLADEEKTARLTARLKEYGISTAQTWGTTDDGQGANRRGFERAHIADAVTQRKRK